ncbi:hypothetical protein VIBHAR_06013 [Vibrio campbellii ATCC BAA-1116]|uniref:Uncharacterized protein n=1 Tax=Vibrio campbellii (strain ATCC BAA-1116) TaxID=2902295 RepID=A7N592_VIBC1|nr:hypothetical protein VIBHAR_06013 [Vibrio campbellii ATCC BAA-1116]
MFLVALLQHVHCSASQALSLAILILFCKSIIPKREKSITFTKIKRSGPQWLDT